MAVIERDTSTSAKGDPHAEDVPERILQWLVAAAGEEARGMRILLPDRSGRLLVAAVHGPIRHSGRLSSMRRRQVFESGLPVRIGGREGLALTIEPLVDRGVVIGVVEIEAPARALDVGASVIRAVIEPSAALLAAEQRREATDRALWSMTVLLRLSSELMRADTPVAAIRSATDLCAEHTGRPVAAARPDRSGTGWFLAASAELGTRKRSQLRDAFRKVVTASSQESQQRAVASAFREVSSARHVDVLPAGDALLLVAEPSRSQREFVESVARVLDDSLESVASLRWARLLNENLDLGMAWTAHELKGPLIGAMAALDYVLVSDNGLDNRDVLLRMRGEIEQLTELVDPLLRWSAGLGSLDIRACDLVSVVRGAVDACVVEESNDRVVVTAPAHLSVEADAAQLRSAITNIVRNALAYSPPDLPVRVDVDEAQGYVSICVRDRGPGINADERDRIFDPFVRGSAGGAAQGKGLGLFIARRVVEAHGGTIALRRRPSGATFCIELPIAAEGRQRSAS